MSTPRINPSSRLPRITVITPSYNQGRFIAQTMDSVLAQGYPDLEYIIVDGGSTDNTRETLESYGEKIRWISETDRGQSDALNKGFRMATGEILCFLNSDDLLAPGALLKVGSYFATHPDVAWLSGKCRTIDESGSEIRRPITIYKNFWLLLKLYRTLFILNFISQPATFWRREVGERVGGFDESLRYAMDYDYWLRIGQRYRLYVTPSYLASFRIHADSKAGSSAHAQFDAEFEIAAKHPHSRILTWLHRAHTSVIVAVYRVLMAKQMDKL